MDINNSNIKEVAEQSDRYLCCLLGAVIMGKVVKEDIELARVLLSLGYHFDWLSALANGNPDTLDDVVDIARYTVIYDNANVLGLLYSDDDGVVV